MESLQCIMTRRSVRNFEKREVPENVIKDRVKAEQFAPSWKNSQIVRYNVVCNKNVLDDIADNGLLGFSHNRDIIKGCSALVVLSVVNGICGYEKDGSYTTSKKDKWEMFDAGIAAQTFCLAAHEKGVGSVILGIFDEYKIADIISLSKNQEIACLIAIGYPAGELKAPNRKDTSDILNFIK